MRILFLGKRQYTGKDLLDDQYGRLFELPVALSQMGHRVAGLCLSYRTRRQGEYYWPEYPQLTWRSLNLATPRLPWLPAYIARTARDFQPDLIVASSDALHLGLGQWLSSKLGTPLVADLYDNYESFGLSKLPGARALIRSACRHALGVATVSHKLAEYVALEYTCRGSIRVIGNGVDKRLFHPRDKAQCRDSLGLPPTGFLVGTAGALTVGRGIQDLLDAFRQLAAQHPQAWLVVAGKRDRLLSNFRHSRLIDLGELPHSQVGVLLSALDVGVVCNRDTQFGRFCFPLKLHEMLAAGIPVVAAAVGDVSNVLAANPSSLYQAGDASGLASRIGQLYQYPASSAAFSPRSWAAVTEDLDAWLRNLQGAAGELLPLASENNRGN